jgi:hypothetical protein
MDRLRESSHDVFLAGLASLARTRAAGAKPAKLPTSTHSCRRGPQARARDAQETVQKTWDDSARASRSTMECHACCPRTRPAAGRVPGARRGAVRAGWVCPSRAELDALNAKLDRLLQMQPAGRGPAPQGQGRPRRRPPAAKPRCARRQRRRPGARPAAQGCVTQDHATLMDTAMSSAPLPPAKSGSSRRMPTFRHRPRRGAARGRAGAGGRTAGHHPRPGRRTQATRRGC